MLIKKLLVVSILLGSANLFAQSADCPPAMVSYSDYEELVAEVKAHRASRLINLETFLKLSNEPGVVILDARSDFRFERIHVKGAKHLTFTEFTQDKLASVIPSTSTKILLYCNNNFEGDQIDFAMKADATVLDASIQGDPAAARAFRRTLALNIPTYITLYGYGYHNVYELNEYVKVTDPRIQFEGTAVRPASVPPTLSKNSVPTSQVRRETKK